MLPPILDVYILWHPDDAEGPAVAGEIMDHFHGKLFTGLIGGAIEVFVRSASWDSRVGTPRPIPGQGRQASDVRAADLTVVVPLVGRELARAVASPAGPWTRYLEEAVSLEEANPEHVFILPISLDARMVDGTRIGEILGSFQSQRIDGRSSPERYCRDLAQGIAQQAAGPHERLTVFISHTKRGRESEDEVRELIQLVRSHISSTRLASFFDAQDLQLGRDWDATLREKAGSSALLALRTDLYSSRTWCQREMLMAKQQGMPVVVLDALTRGEERGSFLMDHVPRVSLHRGDEAAMESSIEQALTLLVDESLKRVLWTRQERAAEAAGEIKVDWWAPHAPEPSTLSHWLIQQQKEERLAGRKVVHVLHPDPPLGADERAVLDQVGMVAGLSEGVDVMTPAALSARATRPRSELLPEDVLKGSRVGLSVSDSADLARLGLDPAHLHLAVGEVARAVLLSEGSIAYGGHLDLTGFTPFLVGEIQRFGAKEDPLLLTLPWSEHRRLDLSELEQREDEFGLFAKVVYLDPRGQTVKKAQGRADAAVPEQDKQLIQRGLTAMRQYQSSLTAGRVLLGGKRRDFEGALPGILEEAMLCLEEGKALYPAGGFGGITLDIAVALGLADDDYLPHDPSDPAPDSRVTSALAELSAAYTSQGVPVVENGLTPEENRALGMSHRPSEVASLVALGLGRLRHR